MHEMSTIEHQMAMCITHMGEGGIYSHLYSKWYFEQMFSFYMVQLEVTIVNFYRANTTVQHLEFPNSSSNPKRAMPSAKQQNSAFAWLLHHWGIEQQNVYTWRVGGLMVLLREASWHTQHVSCHNLFIQNIQIGPWNSLCCWFSFILSQLEYLLEYHSCIKCPRLLLKKEIGSQMAVESIESMPFQTTRTPCSFRNWILTA